MKRYTLICLTALTLILAGGTAVAQFSVDVPGSKGHTTAQQVQEQANKVTNEAIRLESKKVQEATAGKTEEGNPCDFDIELIELESYKYADGKLWTTNEPKEGEKASLRAVLTPPIDTYQKASEFVDEVWFAQEKQTTAGTGVSINDMQAIKEQRFAFLQLVGADVLSHATNLRDAVAADTEAIADANKQPESGCSALDDLFVQNVKLLALVEQQLVNTALQLEALEMTIANDILKETADTSAGKEASPLPTNAGDLLKGVLP